MNRQPVKSLKELLPPDKLLRALALAAFVAAGVVSIRIGRQAGSLLHPDFSRERETVVYFAVAISLFLFFYAQYALIPRLTKQPLSAALGYVQAFGSLALLFYGAARLNSPVEVRLQGNPDLQGQMLALLSLFGELTFVANVIWSFVRARHAPLSSIPTVVSRGKAAAAARQARPVVTPWSWPSSAVRLFGICAACFFLGGLVSMILNFPSLRVPFPLGDQIVLAPMGLLWLACAFLFALFAGLYWLPHVFAASLGSFGNLSFGDLFTRLHFVVTLGAALEMTRLWSAWATSVGSTYLRLSLPAVTEEALAFFGASFALFALNVIVACRSPRVSVTPSPRS